MGCIAIDDLHAGMVLENDVTTQKGRHLLDKGTTINQKQISIMKKWGVMDANIQGVSGESILPDDAVQIDPEMVQKAEKIIKQRFSYNNSKHEAPKELYKLFFAAFLKPSRYRF